MIIDKALSCLSKIKTTVFNSRLVKVGAVVAVAGLAAYTIYENLPQSDKPTRSSPSHKQAPKQETQYKDPKLKSAMDLKDKGNKYFKAKEYQSAIKFYQEALDICPEEHLNNRAICYQNIAVCKENLGQLEEALENCNSAISLDPKYKKAFMRRSIVHERLENYSDAFFDSAYLTFLDKYENFESIMRMDDLMKKLANSLANKEAINLCRDLPNKSTIRNYLDNFLMDPLSCPIDDYLSTPDAPFNLSSKLKSICQTNGDTSDTSPNQKLISFFSTFQKALDQFKNDKFEESYNTIKSALSTYESYQAIYDECNNESSHLVFLALAHLLLYTFCMIRTDTETAAKEIDRILYINKTDNVGDKPLMKLILSNAYIKQANALASYEQDLPGCLSTFEKAIELCPSSPDVYLHRGQIFIRNEDFEKAVTDIEKALSLKPNHSISMSLKVFAEHRKSVSQNDISKKDLYIKKLEKIIEKNPDCFESLSLFANILIDYGDFEKAEIASIKIQEKYPNSAMGYFNCGILYLHWKRDKQEVSKWMKKALEVDPKCESAMEILGQLAMEDGDFEKSLPYFVSAISLARNKNDLMKLIGFRESALVHVNICKKYSVDPQEIVTCIQNMQKRFQANMFQ